MVIGNLNHLVQFSLSNVAVSETGRVPVFLRGGNPLLGEKLYVNWKEKVNSSVEIRLPFRETVFVDCVRLAVPEGPRLNAVSLYSGERAELLMRYVPETNHVLSGSEILLEANEETDLLVLSFEGDFTSVGLDRLEVFGSYGKNALYPTPESAEITDRTVPVSGFQGYWGDCPEGLQAAAILKKKLEAEGMILPMSESGRIRFHREPSVKENGFELSITEAEVSIRAKDLRGFVYGAETVLKLFADGTLPLCRISDAPRMELRGVHLYLPAREEIPFFRRLVEHILSPMGYNTIFLEIAAGMEYESHPEINAAYVHMTEQVKAGIWPEFPHGEVAGGKFLSKKEVADLTAFIRSFGIEVIPEVQSLG
ncbi:MAG: hypothetical protein J5794_04765, partial [Lachnospiraceae bacterium]|nr:hypothetical protein [Lachnospiraceae bacterium]